MDPTTTPQPSRGLVLAGLALVALYVLAQLGLTPPAAKAPDAPANEFSAGRALALLQQSIGDGAPHPAGTAAHARVREKIVAELRRLGYEPQVQETLARGANGIFARVANVIARRPGTSNRKAVLLCAHYDSVAAGPGAGDDGAGVGALLEIARALAADPPAARPVILLFDDAEELGLIGAEAFVREHPWAKDVELAVNLEARGTSGPSMMFETSEENLALMPAFAHALARPVATSVAYEVYKRLPNDTDLTVFKRAGMRGFNFAFIGGLRHYHTPRDDLAHLSPASLQHHGDNALALVRQLAGADVPDFSGRAVYTDVFGAGMIVWPESASLAIALASFALIAVAIVRQGRHGLRIASIGWGALCAALSVLAAAAAGWLVLRAVGALRDAPEPWAAHPQALRLSIASAALAAALLVARSRIAARAGFEGQFFGAWSLFSIAGALVAQFASSACYLFVLPAAIAGVWALLWSFLSPNVRENKREVLVLAALVPLCAMWFPLAIGLELSFELFAAPAIACVWGVALAAVLPLAGEAAARTVSLALRATVALCLGSFCAALLVPAYSADQPQALNVAHYQDVDGARALWSARAFSRWPWTLAKLPAIDRVPPPGWLASDSPEGEFAAPVWDAPAPRVDVVESIPSGASRTVRAQVSSARGARLLGLELPAKVKLVAARWRGHEVRDVRPDDAYPIFAALDADAIELEFIVASAEPIEIHVFDIDAALPAQAADLLFARPPHRVPRSHGDGSIVRARAQL